MRNILKNKKLILLCRILLGIIFRIYNISNYYEEKTEGDETRDVLKESITVTTAAGETVTGRVWHMVRDHCSGTNLRNWFIICTKPYPYIRDTKQAWN